MREHFEEELSKLSNALVEMGALCEDAISCAVKYLLKNDAQMKKNAAEAEKQIDQKEREIETMCMRLLIQQQPVATDFRMITSALKMISDMERIGDQALDIAEIAEYVTDDIKSKINIKEMAETTVKMVMNSVDSYVRKDIDIANSVIGLDDTVDALFDKAKSELINVIRTENENAEGLLDLLMVAKYFERIGDHAENIAEWVIFAVTGNHKA
ncbi:MAG TPA: phosphate signaling complex protein PhoU [Ruminococcus sp.]|jgi:phosphate transport system protein|nr:phosphate signaling complex protein PhoU [Ruminococcus sp.]